MTRYYLSITNYSFGSGKIGNRDDDNNGKGYSLKESRQKSEEIESGLTVKSEGNTIYMSGETATIYSWKGEFTV